MERKKKSQTPNPNKLTKKQRRDKQKQSPQDEAGMFDN